MWDKEKIQKTYDELGELGNIELPDRLWEGGLSSFKLTIDKIRSNQERSSTLYIAVSREVVAAKKALKYLRRLAKSKDIGDQVDQIDDYLTDMSGLQDAVKLIHSDLNRCRTDLKAKIQLLEDELRMGGSGSISRAERNERLSTKGVDKSQVDKGEDIEWSNNE